MDESFEANFHHTCGQIHAKVLMNKSLLARKVVDDDLESKFHKSTVMVQRTIHKAEGSS